MHRCGNMTGQGACSCGAFHHAQSSPLSLLFPADPYSSYPNPYPYSSPSVDCTLSLGTPSTRLSEDAYDAAGRSGRGNGQERRSSISNFCWDILHTTTSSKHAPTASAAATGRSTAGRGGGGGDPLLARRCANCDTTSTPLWRNGPRGPKSLCNACGIRFKKEERRAMAAATASSVDTQPMFSHGQYGSWSAQTHNSKLPSCFGTEFSFIDDSSRDHSDNGISFLSWRLNVTDRPSGLVHDFTR